MSLLDYFKTSKTSSASLAKDRLQILVAHERSTSTHQPSYLPKLQDELLEVVRKYAKVEQDDISVTFEQNDHQETLELSVVLPDERGKK
jgi:cell division topological specificity factor